MSHTPGPWACAGGVYISIWAGSLDDGTYRNIARVGEDVAHSPTDEECEANAEVCAAAPDLLAACKEALPHLEWSNIYGSRCDEALAKTKAAIAKAERQT